MKILDEFYKIPTPIKAFIILGIIIAPISFVCFLFSIFIQNLSFSSSNTVICQRTLEEGKYFEKAKYIRVTYGYPSGGFDAPATNTIEISYNGTDWESKSWWVPTKKRALEKMGLDPYTVFSTPNQEFCDSIANDMKKPEFQE